MNKLDKILEIIEDLRGYAGRNICIRNGHQDLHGINSDAYANPGEPCEVCKEARWWNEFVDEKIEQIKGIII